jgi:hypothetical protein
MLATNFYLLAGMALNPATELSEDSIRAIAAIGTNAIPFVMAKLNARDSPFKLQIQKWAHKLGVKRPLIEDAAVDRGRAVTALVYLPSIPEQTLSQLRTLTTNSDIRVASEAKAILFNWQLFPEHPSNVAVFFVTPGR